MVGLHKDSLPNLQKRNVYKINCKNCDACYVGQMEKTRVLYMKEYMNIKTTYVHTISFPTQLSLNTGCITVMNLIGTM